MTQFLSRLIFGIVSLLASSAHAQLTLGELKGIVLQQIGMKGTTLDSILAAPGYDYSGSVQLGVDTLSLASIRVWFDSLNTLSSFRVTMHLDSGAFAEVLEASKQQSEQKMLAQSQHRGLHPQLPLVSSCIGR